MPNTAVDLIHALWVQIRKAQRLLPQRRCNGEIAVTIEIERIAAQVGKSYSIIFTQYLQRQRLGLGIVLQREMRHKQVMCRALRVGMGVP